MQKQIDSFTMEHPHVLSIGRRTNIRLPEWLDFSDCVAVRMLDYKFPTKHRTYPRIEHLYVFVAMDGAKGAADGEEPGGDFAIYPHWLKLNGSRVHCPSWGFGHWFSGTVDQLNEYLDTMVAEYLAEEERRERG